MEIVKLIGLILDTALGFYFWIVFIYIMLSWFPNAREGGIGRFLGSLAEPYLEPFRKIIPPIGMLDVSPIVALLILKFARDGALSLYRLFL